MSAVSLGLDIGSTGIKFVELARTWRGYRLSRWGVRSFEKEGEKPRREEMLKALEELFPGGQRREEGLVISMPSHRLMVHHLSLPFRERKKNLQVLKYEAEPLLPLPVDQVILDFYPLPANRNIGRALAFAVRKEDLREQLSLAKEAGLDPESVVPEFLALFWAARRLTPKDQDGRSALLDLGSQKTNLIVWQGETLFFVRSIPMAGAAVGSAPGQNEKGRLAEEIHRTLLAYASAPDHPPVERIFLSGGGAASPDLGEDLFDRLGKPVVRLDDAASFPEFLKEVPEESRPLLTAALGAALGGMAGEGERVNFRQEEFASVKKARQTKRRRNLLLSYAAILAVLSFSAFYTSLFLQERRYKNLKAEIRREFLQAQPGAKKVVDEVQQMKSVLREEKTRLDALGGLTRSGSSLEILRELSVFIEPAWKMRVTELVVAPEIVEISGEADSFDTVNRLKAKLDRSALWKEVQLKTAKASTLENIVEFKFQMKRGI